MRVFNSTVEAVKEIERDLWEMGHNVSTRTVQDRNIFGNPNYEAKEVIGYSFTLLDGYDWEESFGALGMKDTSNCIEYVKQEVKERLFGVFPLNPGTSYLKRPEVWEPYLVPGTSQFAYTYPERIFGQFDQVRKLHRVDPTSRQLVIPVYRPDWDNPSRGGKARVPCTMHFQILNRHGILSWIHNMRSLDLYTHLAVDLSISWLMANQIGREWFSTPRVIFQIGSLHAFKKDLEPRGIF